MIQDSTIRDLVSKTFKNGRLLKKTTVYDRAVQMGDVAKESKKQWIWKMPSIAFTGPVLVS